MRTIIAYSEQIEGGLMAVPPYRYGTTTVDNASIDQFVQGVIANDEKLIKRVGKALAVGFGTAFAVTAYTKRRR